MRRPLCIASGLFITGILCAYILFEKELSTKSLLFLSVFLILMSIGLRINGRQNTRKAERAIEAATGESVVECTSEKDLGCFQGMCAPVTGVSAGDKAAEKKKKAMRMQIVFTLCFIAGGLVMSHAYFDFQKIENAIGDDARIFKISGVVLDAVEKESSYGTSTQLTVRTDFGKIICYVDELDEDAVGRSVKGVAELKTPDGRRNPGCFDYNLYLKGKNICAVGTFSSMELGGVENKALKLLHDVTSSFRYLLSEHLNEDSFALLTAILFGDKSCLSDEDYEAYQYNGTAHVLAVSGLHVGMIYAAIVIIFRKKRGKFSNACIALMLFIYAAIADFSPSVVRAFIMILLHIVSRITDRRYDLLTSAMTAAFVILLYEPYALFSVSFQMSFLAVVTIAFTQPVLEKHLMPLMAGRIRERLGIGFFKTAEIILKLFFPIIVLQLALIPCTAYVFNYVSLSSFFANIPLVFVAGLIVPLGILIFAMYCISLALGIACPGEELLLMVQEKLVTLMDMWNAVSYDGGKLAFNAVSPPLVFVLLFYCVGALFLSEGFRILIIRKKTAIAGVLIWILIFAAIFASLVFDSGFGDAEMVFVDVGQGDCLHVKCGSKNVLFDGGGSRDKNLGKLTLRPYLLKNGASNLDVCFFTHLHMDHFKASKELSSIYDIKNAAVSKLYEEDDSDLKGLDADVAFLREGDTVKLGEGILLEVLWPLRDDEPAAQSAASDDDNEMNMVMMLTYGEVKVLITGDLLSEDEKKLAEHYKGTDKLKCDILKVAHHGSKSSSSDEFLDASSPEVAIIQVGKNNMYGHPHADTLKKFEERGIPVYRTDISGAIGIKTDGKTIEVKEMIKSQ